MNDDHFLRRKTKPLTYKTSVQKIIDKEAKLKKVPLFSVEHIEIGDKNVTPALEKDKSCGKLKNGTAVKPGIDIQPLVIPKAYLSPYSFFIDPLKFHFHIPVFKEVKELLIHSRYWHRNFWKIVFGVRGTMIYSPVGLVILLAVMHLSMKGSGAIDIQEVLEIDGEWWDVVSQLAFYFRFVEQDEFVMINKVFVDERFSHFRMYRKFLESLYGGQFLTYVQSHTEDNIDGINRMLDKDTGGLFSSVLELGDIDIQTSVLFMSLLTFQGVWEQPFSPDDVRWEDFTSAANERYQCDIMYMETLVQCDYISELDVKGLLLPFKGGRHVMMFVVQSFYKLESAGRSVDFHKLYDILSQIEPYYVRIGVPKFKIQYKVPIKQLLYCFGVEKPLTNNAHYRRLANNSKKFQSSTLVQKIFLSIGENGTVPLDSKANVTPTLTTNSTPELKFNQPFLFAIMDLNTKSILLCARISQVGNKRLPTDLFESEKLARMSTFDKEVIIEDHACKKRKSLLRQYRRRRIIHRRRRRWRKRHWSHRILTGPHI